MKILYGVVGEGMGHAIRSKVVLEHLLGAGHEVEIMASGRAVEFLKRRFEAVNQIHGLHMITRDNQIHRRKTLWSNMIASLTGVPKNIAAYFSLIDDFAPDVVVSDFESWSYLYAKAHDLPILSIDNMQIINRCTHAPEIYEGARMDFDVAKALVKSKLPFCDYYLITSFFRPPVRKKNTALFPPILRPEILTATSRPGDHLLVYQTGEHFEFLTDILRRTGMECRIYGMRRDIDSEQVDGKLRYRPFDEHSFIDDLASARAVLASAGFTLMGEAVYLRKPMLAIPLENQFEQILNARYLESEGYGMSAESREQLRDLDTFLGRVDEFQENLRSYQQDGNRALLAALDLHLGRAAAGDYG
ncbi:MJ1255/VC2487 family glycosyltransferase [Haliangium ochraceum]|uniref:Putative UDP-glucuronosyltransferase n=1 Tax=Haliangium ochraceum (strain DSM 14365 / JCM 11303 / SMP-2) TaxID=502025 RepID=D0LSY3_HALO1|nr:MJ1255/VC2487 family glycosyltransferase [Haliangium ochraceum]ACY19119.1 putative UDP-glucuronosyltransferase [Haliangium ochraceum DSM 14365]